MAASERTAIRLAGPAASAIENALLHEEIERLFEGFVRASVLAIEQRDPTTAGHSGRVAGFTIGLARAAERSPPPGHAGLRFEPGDTREVVDALKKSGHWQDGEQKSSGSTTR